jgi:hypothetical protein
MVLFPALSVVRRLSHTSVCGHKGKRDIDVFIYSPQVGKDLVSVYTALHGAGFHGDIVPGVPFCTMLKVLYTDSLYLIGNKCQKQNF